MLAEGFLKTGDMEDVVYFAALWKLQLISYGPYLPADSVGPKKHGCSFSVSLISMESCMVATSDRLSRQPQKYDQLGACLLGPSIGFVPSIDDPLVP